MPLSSWLIRALLLFGTACVLLFGFVFWMSDGEDAYEALGMLGGMWAIAQCAAGWVWWFTRR